jgi:hypothetical protein
VWWTSKCRSLEGHWAHLKWNNMWKLTVSCKNMCQVGGRGWKSVYRDHEIGTFRNFISRKLKIESWIVQFENLEWYMYSSRSIQITHVDLPPTTKHIARKWSSKYIISRKCDCFYTYWCFQLFKHIKFLRLSN